ncbi:unnamed protein product [Ectocarpus sp. CCAP 1310/34]|nr:unnamed protein product [Ectocarpus sp. CCAP 1310/34]
MQEPEPHSAYPDLADVGFEPDLELEGRDDSEEDFDTNKDDNGSGGAEGASGNISGRYAPSPRTGAGGNGGIVFVSPAFSPSPVRGPHGGGSGDGEAWRDARACCNDSDDWAIGGGLDEGPEMGDDRDCTGRGRGGSSARGDGILTGGGRLSRGNGSGAICIGGGGSSCSLGHAGWVTTTEELRGDGGGNCFGGEDLALGKSLEHDHGFFNHKEDALYRKVEARSTKSSKNKGLGRGGSSGSLAGRGGGTGGGAGLGGRNGRKSGGSSLLKISDSASTSSSVGGGFDGAGGKKGSGNKINRSASASGGKKDTLKAGLDFDALAGSARKINRSQSLLLVPKQPLSQANMASERKSKTKLRRQEVKKAMKDKEDRCDVEKTAAVGLWQTSGGEWTLAPDKSDESWDARASLANGGDGGGHSSSWQAHPNRLLQAEEGILGRIKKLASCYWSRVSLGVPRGFERFLSFATSVPRQQTVVAVAAYHPRIRTLRDTGSEANRPLDSMVRKAQTSLAKALRKGGKLVLLPGLELRYPQNVAALLDDAAQAWEHGLLHPRRGGNNISVASGVKTPLAWTKSWSPIQVMDLSGNDLEGIDSLLMVETLPGVAGGVVSKDGGAGNQSEAGGRRTAPVYPLAGLRELRLNGNMLHGLPGNMALVLPSLEKLELSGNWIEEIRAPRAPLPSLKHLDLGYNSLLELPAEVCLAMPSLEVLLLPNNLLEWLPREVGGLRHLKRLDVGRNPLTSPPVEVAARGLDSVKRYFRDVEGKHRDDDDDDDMVAEEVQVEVPNLVKVIFIGHADAGKSEVVKGLLSTKPHTNNDSSIVSTPANSTPSLSATSTPLQQPRRLGAAPRTPPPPPPPPDDDDEGWQVVGTGRQRSLPASNPPPNRPQHGRSEPPPHGVGTPASGRVRGSGTKTATARSGGGGGAAAGGTTGRGGESSASRERRKVRGGSFVLAQKSLLTPDSPEQVAMDIQTVTYTPTSGHRGRKHLGGGGVGVVRPEEGGKDNSDNAAGVATPKLSGYGGDGGGDGDTRNITLKLWDFGGTEDFHAVHGLFFSGRALYTVVFDLRHVNRDEIDERVQFWVDCVQTRVPGSLILLVGTHADCMSPAEAKAEIDKVREQLEENERRIVSGLEAAEDSHAAAGLSHLRNRPKIVPKMFAVSCRHHQGFREFREQVLNLAGDAKRFPPSRLPPTWWKADRLVKQRREEGHHIISVGDLVVGLRDGVGGEVPAAPAGDGQSWEDSRNAVVSTLEWLNDTSEVVYFNKPGLDEFVILHPRHLMSAIKQVVRRDLKEELSTLVRHHQEKQQQQRRQRLLDTPTMPTLLPQTSPPCPSDYPPLAPSSTPSSRRASGQGQRAAAPGAPRSQASKGEPPSLEAAPAAAAAAAAASTSAVAPAGSENARKTAKKNASSPKPGGESAGQSRRSSPRFNHTSGRGSGRGSSAPHQIAGAWGRGAGRGGNVPVVGSSPASASAATAGPNGDGGSWAAAVGYLSVAPAPARQAGDVSNPSPVTTPPPAAAAASSANDNDGKRPSYLETLSKGAAVDSGGGANSNTARRTSSGGSSPAPVPEAVLTYRDEQRLDDGFVSRAAIDALLEPLAEFNCNRLEREFLIRLFQESCVLVKATDGPPSRPETGKGAAKVKGPPRGVVRSQSMGPTGSKKSASAAASREQEVEYFIPCLLPTRPIEWTASWVANVHCGRRWHFQRFVPPSLMSALISRFYGMGKRGSASLSRRSIYIKVPIRGNSGGNGGTTRRRGEAEVFLKLHRGGQHNALLSMQSPRLELLAQAESHRREGLMRGLEGLVKEVDKTLDEFPGLLFERRVPCPACMEKKPGDPAAWGGLPLEMVEDKRSCPGDLPMCKYKCRLQDLQKRLMFVGELHPEGDEADGGALSYHHRRHGSVWVSPLPELGVPGVVDGAGARIGDRDGGPYRGFGVPRVETLFPAVCPIAIYDCVTQRTRAHATAFIVKSEKGYLLSAAHTFLKFKFEENDGGGEDGDEGRNAPRRGRWCYHDGVTHENCIVLVGTFQSPSTTRWEFVAEALQHSELVRSKLYYDIGWNKDHPVLLRIKRRFSPIPTKVVDHLVFKDVTRDWRARAPGGDVVNSTQDQRLRDHSWGLTALKLGDSRQVHNRPKGDVEYLTIYPEALLEVLKEEDNDVCMTMTVFPQELLTLVAFPEHTAPYFSSISVTHGPVARNMVGQDVIEVLLSNHPGASGGPVVDKRGEVVGILSQGNQFGAYVMGISTAKTILNASTPDLETIFTDYPLMQRCKAQHAADVVHAAALRAAANAAASDRSAVAVANGGGDVKRRS